MENTGIFGMDADFVSTLSSEQLGELQSAKATIDKYGELYTKWGGGISHDDIADHLKAVAAAQRKEAADCQRVVDRFK